MVDCVVTVDVDLSWVQLLVHQNLNDNKMTLIGSPVKWRVLANLLRVRRRHKRISILLGVLTLLLALRVITLKTLLVLCMRLVLDQEPDHVFVAVTRRPQ